MDTLVEYFNIFTIKDNEENYQDKISKIFVSDTNIFEIYNYIRCENISSDIKKIILLRNITKDYIEEQLLLINSIETCNNIINQINNKLSRIKMLFNYIRNRNNKDIFIDFIEDYYKICIKNIHIFIEYIFKPLIDPKIKYDYIPSLSFKILIEYFNYEYNYSCNEVLYNIHLDFYNKYTSQFIYFFTNTIKLYLISHQTLKYSDFIADFKLIKKNIIYEQLMSLYLHKFNNNIPINTIYKNILLHTNLPILNIIKKVNIYTIDQDFFDILKDIFDYSPNFELSDNIIKIIKQIESNLIITKEKYGSENLIIELAKIFRVYNKIRYSCSSDQNIINEIIISINNILNYDDIIINYISCSLIIIIKKINSDNNDIFKDLIMNISSNISISNKNSDFLNMFYQNIKSNLLQTKLTLYFLDYINSIIKFFDNNTSNYNKIIKFLDEIYINIKYNKEIALVPIKCNKLIPINMNICNTFIIYKDFFKNKIKITDLKLPDEILVYFKTYEQFYNIKHNLRSIEWSIENSFIDININNYTISGGIIPISILLLIAKNKNVTFKELIILLEISNIEYQELINNNIQLLQSNNIIQLVNNSYVLLNIKSNINLTNLYIKKNKIDKKIDQSIDINNSTDCYLIKILKPLNGNGLLLKKIYDEFNNINKYIKITEDFMKTRLDILIKKNYVYVKDNLYYYET